MRPVHWTHIALSPTPTVGTLKHQSEMDPILSLWKNGRFGYWCLFHELQMSTSCQVDAGCLIFISCLVCRLLHPPQAQHGTPGGRSEWSPGGLTRWKVSDHSSHHDSHQSSSSSASVYDVQDTNSDVDWASEYSQYKENNPQQREDWIIKLW